MSPVGIFGYYGRLRLALIHYGGTPMRSFEVEGLKGIRFRSQLGQDAWVACMTGLRRGGYFVEIGAYDGVEGSNTYTLEEALGWRGLEVEANPEVYKALVLNRPAATCVERAVFPGPETVMEFTPHSVLGTLIGFENLDMHAETRNAFLKVSDNVKVKTISPDDLFAEAKSPHVIDYVSIDTEGSEWDILSAIDHDRWHVALYTIEHNFLTDKRENISNFLKSKGYIRFCALIDDWFFHPEYLQAVNGSVVVDVPAVLKKFTDEGADGFFLDQS